MTSRVDQFRVLVLGVLMVLASSAGVLAQQEVSSELPQTIVPQTIDPEGFRVALLEFVGMTDLRAQSSSDMPASLSIYTRSNDCRRRGMYSAPTNSYPRPSTAGPIRSFNRLPASRMTGP